MLNKTLRELEQQIRDTELRVIEHDRRALESLRGLRGTATRAVSTRLIAGVGLLVTGWLLRRPGTRRRHAGAAPRRGFPSFGLLQRLLPLLLPALTPLLNRKVALQLAQFGLPIATAALPPLRTQPVLDLQRFGGLWYEIARLPNKAERRCARDACVYYAVDADGLKVVTRCVDVDGTVQEDAGRARQSEPQRPGEIEVSFSPRWLRWWPGAWHDHWVLYVDAEYAVALVGSPERDRLWVLAREPQLPDAALHALLALAERLEFDVSKVELTLQSEAQVQASAEEPVEEQAQQKGPPPVAVTPTHTTH